jgi:WD40 repeat protein
VLGKLKTNCHKCAANPNHLFGDHLAPGACPWCALKKKWKRDPFPSPGAVPRAVGTQTALQPPTRFSPSSSAPSTAPRAGPSPPGPAAPRQPSPSRTRPAQPPLPSPRRPARGSAPAKAVDPPAKRALQAGLLLAGLAATLCVLCGGFLLSRQQKEPDKSPSRPGVAATGGGVLPGQSGGPLGAPGGFPGAGPGVVPQPQKPPTVEIAAVEPPSRWRGGTLTVQVKAVDGNGAAAPVAYRTDPEGEWKPLPEGEVKFTRVEAGSLRLEFQAKDRWGTTSEVARTVQVLPNPWSTWRQLGESKGRDQVGALRDLGFSPGGAVLAGAAADNTLRLWRAADGQILHTIEIDLLILTDRDGAGAGGPPGAGARGAGFPGGPGPAAPPSGSRPKREPAPRPAAAAGAGFQVLAYSPDGMLLAGGEDNWVRLWHAASGESVPPLQESGGAVRSLAFSADGKLLAAGSAAGTREVVSAGATDRRVVQWQLASGKLPRTTSFPNTENSWCVAYSLDGRVVALGGQGGTIKITDFVQSRPIASAHPGGVTGLAFAGDTLVSAGEDRALRFWRLSDGEMMRALEGHPGPVRTVAFDADRTVAACATGADLIWLWRLADGQLLHRLEGHTGAITCLTFSKDGETLVSGGEDKTIRFWRVADGQARHTLGALPEPVCGLLFSPDGKLLVGGVGKAVQCWGAGPAGRP